MNHRAFLFSFMLIAAAGLGGCNVLPAQAPQPQLHDFGPLPAAGESSGAGMRVDRVTAPAWIDDGAIHYRLLYSDPTSLRSYAEHRWAAPPSDMFRLRLQALLAGNPASPDARPPPRLLSVELVEFEQEFTAAQQANVTLVAEVSLRKALDGQILGQKRFVLTAPSAPDVHGAVADLAKSAQLAAEQIAAWCDAQDRADGSNPSE